MKNIHTILLLLFICSPALAEDKSVDPVGIVENLSKIEITPKEKTILLEALNNIAEDRFESPRRKILRQELLDALEKLAKTDSSIAKTLSFILAKGAEEALFQAEMERTQWLINKAREVYPEELAVRDEILERLADHPLLKNKPVKIPVIASTTSKQTVKKKIQSPEKFKILLLVAGALWLISILSYLFAGKAPKTEEQKTEKQKKKEKVEVKKTDLKREQLLEFFNLDEESSEEDLVKIYRKMAKAVHPDAGEHGMDYDFHKLQDMFEQTRRIVFKVKS